MECLKQLGNDERREEVLNEGIGEFGRYFSLYHERAELWREKGQYDKMAKDGKKYVELADCHVEAYLETGDAYYLMGDHDEEAISWYEKGLEIHPDAWLLWKAMGLTYGNHIEDYKKAIDCLEQAVKFHDKGTESRRKLLILLIEACEKQGDELKLHQYAKSLLNILLENPVAESYNAEMFRQFGYCCLKLGDTLSARLYLERAENEQLCKLYDERCEEALFGLGEIQEALGQKEKALEYYQTAQNVCPCEKYEEAVRRLSGKNS